MSFRFQKRVRVAPGVRINFSKRGVSSTVGPRGKGASLTAGKRGLYGNAGIPGTGLSYRSKLNKSSNKTSGKVSGRSTSREVNAQPIEVIWDETLQDIRFEKSNGDPLSEQEETLVRKQYKNQLIAIYEDKAKEINDKTEKLLDLHHQLFHPVDSLETIANKSAAIDIEKPNETAIYQNLYDINKTSLTIFEKIKLLLPTHKKKFATTIKQEASLQYQEELRIYLDEEAEIIAEKKRRNDLAKHVLEGQVEAMEEWISLFLDELDFPLETDVDFKIVTSQEVYVDIDLPNLEEVPIKKAKVMKSVKLKIADKTQRDHREHYALMIGGSALYLASFFFTFLPTLKQVTLSGYNQVLDRSTGHEADQYIYSLKIDREVLYSLNTSKVHPLEAFQQFQPRLNSTKTYIFKEIEPYA